MTKRMTTTQLPRWPVPVLTLTTSGKHVHVTYMCLFTCLDMIFQWLWIHTHICHWMYPYIRHVIGSSMPTRCSNLPAEYIWVCLLCHVRTSHSCHVIFTLVSVRFLETHVQLLLKANSFCLRRHCFVLTMKKIQGTESIQWVIPDWQVLYITLSRLCTAFHGPDHICGHTDCHCISDRSICSAVPLAQVSSKESGVSSTTSYNDEW